MIQSQLYQKESGKNLIDMNTYRKLEERIEAIERRNKRVELDKAWETSSMRKIAVILNTYVLIGISMWYLGIEKPEINAIIPSIGFYLSTFTLPFIKKWWISRV